MCTSSYTIDPHKVMCPTQNEIFCKNQNLCVVTAECNGVYMFLAKAIKNSCDIARFPCFAVIYNLVWFFMTIVRSDKRLHRYIKKKRIALKHFLNILYNLFITNTS